MGITLLDRVLVYLTLFSVKTSLVAAGDTALRLPERLVITLDRVFEDDAVAELLTTNKLSELACLTLYLMYEKKRGSSSVWHEYIKVRSTDDLSISLLLAYRLQNLCRSSPQINIPLRSRMYCR